MDVDQMSFTLDDRQVSGAELTMSYGAQLLLARTLSANADALREKYNHVQAHLKTLDWKMLFGEQKPGVQCVGDVQSWIAKNMGNVDTLINQLHAVAGDLTASVNAVSAGESAIVQSMGGGPLPAPQPMQALPAPPPGPVLQGM